MSNKTATAIPVDAHIVLSFEEMTKWCEKAKALGYLDEAEQDGCRVFFITWKGTEYLDKEFRALVTGYFESMGAPYTQEQYLHVLSEFIKMKNETSNPVFCVVQYLYEDHQYRQSLN